MHTARIVLVLGAVALSGCAFFGRQQKDHALDPETVSKIEKGMPKADVVRILGAPTEIVFSNKAHDPLLEHAYVYEHTSTRYTGIVLALVNFGNMDQKRDRVIVWFDAEGKVESVGASLRAAESSYGFPFGR